MYSGMDILREHAVFGARIPSEPENQVQVRMTSAQRRPADVAILAPNPKLTTAGSSMPALIRRILHLHWLLTLFLMGAFAMAFGLLSLNLFMILRANVNLIAAHGAMALMDGAFVQLLGLIGYGYLGVIAFLLFKACEKVLVERLLR
jgi:hypothetical protein